MLSARAWLYQRPPPRPLSSCRHGPLVRQLLEVMVSGVLQTDGFVELIEPDARLAAYEG